MRKSCQLRCRIFYLYFRQELEHEVLLQWKGQYDIARFIYKITCKSILEWWVAKRALGAAVEAVLVTKDPESFQPPARGQIETEIQQWLYHEIAWERWRKLWVRRMIQLDLTPQKKLKFVIKMFGWVLGDQNPVVCCWSSDLIIFKVVHMD